MPRHCADWKASHTSGCYGTFQKPTERNGAPRCAPLAWAATEEWVYGPHVPHFRPNPIGLSSVRITAIHLNTPHGPVIEVEGADLMNGTPIFDIKPYLPFTDCHPEATGGFASEQLQTEEPLQVEIPQQAATLYTPSQLEALTAVLQSDPRPQYQSDPHRVYVLPFAHTEVRFTVQGKQLQVLEVVTSNEA